MRYSKLSKYIDEDDSVLELGCGTGENQLNSNFAELLDKIDYLGLDVIDSKLNSIKTNVFDYIPESDKYDKILAYELFEHVGLRDWRKLFLKYFSALKVGSLFIITVPYKQDSIKHLNRKLFNHGIIFEEFNSHVVFNLKKGNFDIFFKSLNINTEWFFKVIISEILFKDKYKPDTTLRATLRYFKRFLLKLFHLDRSMMLSSSNVFLCKRSLVVFVKKKEPEKERNLER